jgi:hypothetical protein
VSQVASFKGLRDLIDSLDDRFDDVELLQIVSSATGRVLTDLRCLEITCGEYLSLVDDYVALVQTRLGALKAGAPDLGAFDEQLRIQTLLHLRIETFYFFAQRLLDHLVFAADMLRGPAAITIGRHRTLKKNLGALVTSGTAPQPSAAFWPLVEDVTRRIKNFRDDYVAHPGSPHQTKSTALLLDEGVPRIHLGISSSLERPAVGHGRVSCADLLDETDA